jgi:hypothetical protein
MRQFIRQRGQDMPAEHNDFCAFALTSSRGFKFVTIFVKKIMYFKCAFHYCFLHILAKDLQSICFDCQLVNLREYVSQIQVLFMAR